MKKKFETPLQGYLPSIVAFIVATVLGIVVFSAVSQHAVRITVPVKADNQCFQAERTF